MITKWKRLDSTYLFRKPPWLVVRKDKIISPKGVVMEDYFVLEYPHWVNVIALTEDDKFVFVRQYRHALGEVNYELSAGVCDHDDENFMMSAKRELLEETGYGEGVWSLWMINSSNPGTHTNLTYCYLAEGVRLITDQKLDETEEMTVHLLDRGQVMDLLTDNKIRQSLHAAALWKYFALNNSGSE